MYVFPSKIVPGAKSNTRRRQGTNNSFYPPIRGIQLYPRLYIRIDGEAIASTNITNSEIVY